MHRNHFSNKKDIFTLSFLSKITKKVLVLNHVPLKLFSPSLDIRFMIRKTILTVLKCILLKTTILFTLATLMEIAHNNRLMNTI